MHLYVVFSDTNWCGTKNNVLVECEKSQIKDITNDMAYDNFCSFGFEDDIAEGEEEGEYYEGWFEEYDPVKHEDYCFETDPFDLKLIKKYHPSAFN